MSINEPRWTGEPYQPQQQPQPIIINNAPTVERKKTNHILHLLLTVFTGGLWLPVWVIIGLKNWK